jgi:hypothetical protein
MRVSRRGGICLSRQCQNRCLRALKKTLFEIRFAKTPSKDSVFTEEFCCLPLPRLIDLLCSVAQSLLVENCRRWKLGASMT